jgi:hypothetical protein
MAGDFRRVKMLENKGADEKQLVRPLFFTDAVMTAGALTMSGYQGFDLKSRQ